MLEENLYRYSKHTLTHRHTPVGPVARALSVTVGMEEGVNRNNEKIWGRWLVLINYAATLLAY